MSKKFSETEKWYLLSNKDQIMSYRQYNIEKSDNLSKKKAINVNKWDEEGNSELKKEKKERKGTLYIYKNRIYFGKKPQTGSGAVSHIIARLLENVGDVIGL